MRLTGIIEFAFIVIMLIACATTQAFADGVKLPLREVKEIPGIPSQRALIVFRNGMESLTIESSFESKGDLHSSSKCACVKIFL